MMPAPTALSFRTVDAGAVEDEPVSPPREARSTDLAKASLPIAWVAGIAVAVGGFGVSQAMSMAAMRSDVRDILTRMQYESQLRNDAVRLSDARFEALESKIESAGLRNFNMQMAQELAKKAK